MNKQRWNCKWSIGIGRFQPESIVLTTFAHCRSAQVSDMDLLTEEDDWSEHCSCHASGLFNELPPYVYHVVSLKTVVHRASLNEILL